MKDVEVWYFDNVGWVGSYQESEDYDEMSKVMINKILVDISDYDEVVKENELLKRHKGLDVVDGEVFSGYVRKSELEELKDKYESLKREIKEMLNNLNSEEGDVAYIEWDYVRKINKLLED